MARASGCSSIALEPKIDNLIGGAAGAAQLPPMDAAWTSSAVRRRPRGSGMPFGVARRVLSEAALVMIYLGFLAGFATSVRRQGGPHLRGRRRPCRANSSPASGHGHGSLYRPADLQGRPRRRAPAGRSWPWWVSTTPCSWLWSCSWRPMCRSSAASPTRGAAGPAGPGPVRRSGAGHHPGVGAGRGHFPVIENVILPKAAERPG